MRLVPTEAAGAAISCQPLLALTVLPAVRRTHYGNRSSQGKGRRVSGHRPSGSAALLVVATLRIATAV